MYKCKTCEKEFENRRSYIGHSSSHRPRKRTNVIEKTKNPNICRHCKREFPSGSQLGGHSRGCNKNPSYREFCNKIGNLKRGITLSKEHKEKISKARIEYLNKNPGQIPYLLNHSSRESYPEKLFREALEKENISDWKYNFPVKRFALDFAFPKFQVDIEIDGDTHLSELVKKKDSRRDQVLFELGWKVYRFKASDIIKNLQDVMKQVLDIVKSNRLMGYQDRDVLEGESHGTTTGGCEVL